MPSFNMLIRENHSTNSSTASDIATVDEVILQLHCTSRLFTEWITLTPVGRPKVIINVEMVSLKTMSLCIKSPFL